MINQKSARGMLLGLAAGDKNLGPFKMCSILLHSLVESEGAYDPAITLVGYLTWYRNRELGWDDSGPTSAKVFERFLNQEFKGDTPLHTSVLENHSLHLIPLPSYSTTSPFSIDKGMSCFNGGASASSPSSNIFPVHHVSIDSSITSLSSDSQGENSNQYLDCDENLFHHANVVHQQMRGMTGGVNAAHRCAPLSLLFGCYDDQLVINWVIMESRLTHGSSISSDCCIALVKLLSYFLHFDWEGGTRRNTELKEMWINGVITIAEQMNHVFAVSNALLEGLEVTMRPHLSRGGYCLDVLRSAIFFITHTSSLSDALEQSLVFAYPANYCPVLVGALGGALYGVDALPPSLLKHWPNAELTQCEKYLDLLLKMIKKMEKSAWTKPNGIR